MLLPQHILDKYNFPGNLDLSNLIDEADSVLRPRRIISRIMMASNIIAMVTSPDNVEDLRSLGMPYEYIYGDIRGPANYIEMANVEFIQKYLTDGFLAGIKVTKKHEALNVITVGHRSSDREELRIQFTVTL